jgi:hypothetical protein
MLLLGMIAVAKLMAKYLNEVDVVGAFAGAFRGRIALAQFMADAATKMLEDTVGRPAPLSGQRWGEVDGPVYVLLQEPSASFPL